MTSGKAYHEGFGEEANLYRGRKIASACVALALMAGMSPAPALAESLALGSSFEVRAQEYAGTGFDSADSLADGTYRFSSVKCSTGMVVTNDEDGPAFAVVKGDAVWLVLDVYNPNKYDGMWMGKRDDAPVDPYDASVVKAVMLPKGDYSGSSDSWTDAEGLVGAEGTVYKACRFVMPMDKQSFFDMLENESDEDFLFAIRRAAWSPSNPGKWMGSNNNYFTFGDLSRVSDSTDVPTPDAGDSGGGSGEDAGGGSGSGGQTASIDQVKSLIDALTYDPFQVKLSDKDAIEAAQAAFDSLPKGEQKQLDVQEAGNHVLTYGRTLQCALWGLYTLSPVDNATSLRDGTYTKQFLSTCNMGKSSSSRGFKFTATKVTVRDGRAYATIEHATASPETLKSGGILYGHSNADEGAKSTFDIPVKLNSVFYVSQMAKAKTANTVAIPYEMSIQIDERTAVPDPPEKATSPASEPDGSGKAKAPARQPGSKKPKLGPGSAHKAGPAQAKASGAGKDAAEGGKPGAKAEKDGKDAKESKGKDGKDGKGRAKGPDSQIEDAEGASDSASDGFGAGGTSDSRGYIPYAAGSTAILVGAGALAFTLDYRRRDGKAVDVSGVGITKDRG